MAESDVERVREMFVALQRDGVEGLLPYIHQDFTGEVPPELSAEPGVYRGLDGLRRYFAAFDDAVDDVRWELDELEDAGPGLVVSVGRVHGRGRTTDIPIAFDAIALFELRAGRALRIDAHPSVDAARAAAAERLEER